MTDLTFHEYQEFAKTTAIYPKEFAGNYPILGLVGEAGELANKYKKIIRDKNNKPELSDLIALAEELGDVLWYCAALANDIGFDLEEIASLNIKKLKSRQERKVIQGSGDNR